MRSIIVTAWCWLWLAAWLATVLVAFADGTWD